MQAKCRICGKHLDVGDAYCVTKEKANGCKNNFYYCSEKEYTDYFKNKELKDKTYQLCAEILDTHFNEGPIRKMLIEVANIYDYNAIFNYLYDNQDKLYRQLKNKTFQSIFGEIVYLKAILLSDLEWYQKSLNKEEVRRILNDIENIDIIPTKKKIKKRRSVEEMEGDFSDGWVY